MALRATFAAWVGLALLVGVAAFAAGRRVSPVAPASLRPVVEATSVESPLTVHVAGAVAAPGLVVVPADARLSDAIAAAGGATADADLGAVNLAEPLGDGTRVEVPRAGEVGAHVPAGVGSGLIRLNTASTDELTALPGIGPVLARRIVDHREAVGAFESVEDLLDVSGIGERLLAGIRELVVP